MRGRCELKADARLSAASSSKTNQNQSATPPILNQIARQNRRLIGHSKPNLRAKIRAGVPYTAGTAAQNAAARILTEKFSPDKSSPEPSNLITWPAAPQLLSPTIAELYNQALAKSKRWQSIQSKPTHFTHSFYHPQAPNRPYKNRCYR